MLPRRLRTLETNLTRGTTEERVATIEELGRTHHGYALDLLYPIANADSLTLATGAQQAFGKFCVANPKIAMRHGSTFIRHEAAFVLGRDKVVAAIDELARVARNDSDEALRLACVEALGTIATPTVVPGLRSALKDNAIKVRQSAFDALRSIGGSTVESAVADLLADYDWELRSKAHVLLQTTGWVPVTREQKALWGIVNGRFDDVVSQLPEAIEPLLAATLRVSEPSVRQWSATALSRIGSSEARRRLRGALASPTPAIREAAREALLIFGDSLANQPAVVPAVAAPSQGRRQDSLNGAFHAATWFLSLLGHP